MSRSIIQEGHYCYLCSLLYGDDAEKPGLEKHHIIGGPYRKLSEHYGLTVYLCRKHHTGDESGSKEAVHHPEFNGYSAGLKKTAQTEFEKRHGHALWMEEFGRNYLDSD